MQESRETPEPGHILAGKYRVERIIGEGAMGYVLGAYHLELEERVAIKCVRNFSAAGPEAIERFLREAKLCAKIQSDHVVRVRDVGRDDNAAPFIVMEFLEGQDLSSLVNDHKHLSPETAVDYVIQACEAVAEAHSMGIVHRDLKLQNLFLARRKDGSEIVKVLDFGISKVTNAAQAMTMGTAILGSPLYMSPEQMRSSRDVDARSDIWSMGIVLYELLTGRVPFIAESLPELCIQVMNADAPRPSAIAPEIPPALERVVLGCLAKNPNDRPSHVGMLVQALAPFSTARSRANLERIARIQPSDPRDSSIHVPPSSTSQPMLPIQARTLAMGPGGSSVQTASSAGSVSGQTTPNWSASQSTGERPKRSHRALVLGGGLGLLLVFGLGLASLRARLLGRGGAEATTSAEHVATGSGGPTPSTSIVNEPAPTQPATPPATASTGSDPAASSQTDAGVVVSKTTDALRVKDAKQKPKTVTLEAPKPTSLQPASSAPHALGDSRR
jgi:serine/threonine protein kinase